MSEWYELVIYLDTKKKSYIKVSPSPIDSFNKIGDEKIIEFNDEHKQMGRYVYIDPKKKEELNLPDHIDAMFVDNSGVPIDLYSLGGEPLDSNLINKKLCADYVHAKYDINNPNKTIDVYYYYIRRNIDPDAFKEKILNLYKDVLNENDLNIVNKLFNLVIIPKYVGIRLYKTKKLYIACSTFDHVKAFLELII